MKYQLAVFDMDGTILDTLEDLKDSLNYALALNDLPARSLDEVRSFVGNGIGKLIERGVPFGTSAELTKKVFEDFTPHYQAHCADKTKPYDGVRELISQLHKNGMKTAVVSNKADAAVQALCRQYFEGLFDAAVGEQPSVRKKPAPDSVNAVLEQLQVARESAVYIGDSEVDVETAKNAGLNCIAVEWGFRDKAFLKSKGAEIIVSSPQEILKLLLPNAE